MEKKHIMQCGCDCDLGPVEKQVVELMRLNTPPYEILRALAKQIDETNRMLSVQEDLIYKVKENGEDVLVPRKLSDLVDDIGFAKTTELELLGETVPKKQSELMDDIGLAKDADLTALGKTIPWKFSDLVDDIGVAKATDLSALGASFPKKISDLTDDFGLAKATDIGKVEKSLTDYQGKTDGKILQFGLDLAKKLNAEELSQKVREYGFATETDMRSGLSLLDGRITGQNEAYAPMFEGKLNKSDLDVYVAGLGFKKEDEIRRLIEEAKPTRDYILSLGFITNTGTEAPTPQEQQ